MAGVAGSQPQDLQPVEQQSPSIKPTAASPASEGPTQADIQQAMTESTQEHPSQDDVQQAIQEAQQEPASPGLLETAGRVLDYPGGNVRTGLATAAGLATGKNVVSDADVMNTLKGKAPSSAEYMQRLGVPEGSSWQIPGVGKISERDIGGFVLDIATDPMTALNKIVKATPVVQRFFGRAPVAQAIAAVVGNPAGIMADTAGRYIYRGTFGKLAEKIGPKAADKVATQLLEKGAPTSAAAVDQTASKLSQEMAQIRKGFYDYADQLGAKIDLGTADLSKTEELLNKWKKTNDPALQTAVEGLSDMLDKYKARGSASIADVSTFKTNLRNALPASAFEETRFGKKPMRIAEQFKATLASDLKDEIVDAGNKAERGLGNAIDGINDKWGPLIEAHNPLAKQAATAGRPNTIGQQIDAMLLFSHNIPVAIARKAMEIAQVPAARRVVGKALMDAGQSGIADALTRRVIDSQRGGQ